MRSRWRSGLLATDGSEEACVAAPRRRVRERVLVVDDDGDLRQMLELYLHVERLAHDAVADGRDALDRLAHEEYGCILLDLVMPGFDGFAVLHAIGCRWPDLLQRVIVLTGASSELAGGVDEAVFRVVTKSVPMRELMAIVKACVRQPAACEAER